MFCGFTAKCTLRTCGKRFNGNPIRQGCFEVDQLVCGLELFIGGNSCLFLGEMSLRKNEVHLRRLFLHAACTHTHAHTRENRVSIDRNRYVQHQFHARIKKKKNVHAGWHELLCATLQLFFYLATKLLRHAHSQRNVRNESSYAQNH